MTHEHEWIVDYSQPTFDVYPEHYAVYCKCGATACQVEGGAVHDIDESNPSPEVTDETNS